MATGGGIEQRRLLALVAMMSRPALLSLVLLTATALGCGKDRAAAPSAGPAATVQPTAPAGPADPRSLAIIAKSKELRDRACACPDQACATAVRADHDRWLRAQIDEFAKLGEPRSTEAEQAEASKWQRELFKCLEAPAKSVAPSP